MGKAKTTRKFAQTKRLISLKDARIKKPATNKTAVRKDADGNVVREIPQVASSLFFQFNNALHPPYRVLIDTNFINFCIKNKIDLVRGLMDTLLAKCIPCITDCVLAELEKLGQKFRLALQIAKDPRFERLTCSHKGTYADDCLVDRCLQSRCYLVASNDLHLKQRIRKIPGVPILYVGNHVIKVERLPDLLH
ncbi:rRNA processing protein Fcf1 [Protomyces lactucae-debilis]|uniref:rRNA processing protein Fcf1 n=1 Tax=Protomyces lactucae-debilis TaxID=2754530 RepID=A0A1Y2FK43_PROLT|nr:rRNA processing protein Fcf1 [Protomyces lactucae-debilis]ORY84299.1 rRNA processing protein Fcf1 [Protomyces lactucae-debilis]